MATSGKSPVSALQELTAARKQSLPTYFEEEACGGFKCSVYAAGVTAIGFGTTKKIAKQESAKNALEKLKTPSSILILQEGEEHASTNYVGDLNELHQKKGIACPEYSPSQILAGTDEYMCTCTFWGRKVFGRGKGKKEAKQNAAKNMLKLIRTAEAVSVHSNSPTATKITVESQGVEELRSVFGNLTLHSLAMQSPTGKSAEIKFVEEDSVEMLSTKLRTQGVNFAISEINCNPYILSLKIKDTDYIFVENGDTREETVRKLLRKVLLVKESGCALEPPPVPILQESSSKNYVGDLNDFSLKRGLGCPEYSPSQIWPGMNEYMCTCTFWGRKVSGIGKGKKEAKQNAAKNMLKLIHTAETVSVHSDSPKVTKITVESQDEELRSVFDNLTFSLAMQSPTGKSAEIRFVEEDSVEMLSAKLRAQGVDFAISEMNCNPYVLSLKIRDTDYVFVENGDTREETVRKLLRKVLLVKESGCALSSDLIRL